MALALDYTATSGAPGQPGTYTIGLSLGNAPAPAGTDTRAIQDGFVSVTPLDADRDVDGSTEGWLRSIL